MARKRFKRPQRPKTKKRRQRRRKNSLGNVVINGVRTLLPLLPGGTALKSIADMVFKSVGLTTEMFTDGVFVYGTLNIYSCAAVATIGLENIVSRSPLVVRSTESASTNINKIKFSSPLIDGRLLNLSVTCRPDNSVSARRGKWGLCYVPFRSSADKEFVTKHLKSITLVELASMPYSIVGPADKLLHVQFTPTPRDSLAYGYLPLEQDMGMIVVVYNDECRDNYSKPFTAAQFSPNITVKGRVICGQPLGGTASQTYYDDTIDILPSSIYISGAPIDGTIGLDDYETEDGKIKIPIHHFLERSGLTIDKITALME